MPKRIFVDIETLPPGEEMRELFAAELMLHCADKQSVTSVPEKVEEEFRKLALSGEVGRVLAIGVIVERNKEILHQGIIGRDRTTRLFHLNEERTLRSF